MLVNKEVYVYMRPSSTEESGYRFVVACKDLRWATGSEDILLDTVNVEIGIADYSQNELALKAIATLRERQERVLAEAEVETQRLQEKIDRLLLLPHLGDE